MWNVWRRSVFHCWGNHLVLCFAVNSSIRRKRNLFPTVEEKQTIFNIVNFARDRALSTSYRRLDLPITGTVLHTGKTVRESKADNVVFHPDVRSSTDSGALKTILTVECRGIEVTKYHPRVSIVNCQFFQSAKIPYSCFYRVALCSAQRVSPRRNGMILIFPKGIGVNTTTKEIVQWGYTTSRAE